MTHVTPKTDHTNEQQPKNNLANFLSWLSLLIILVTVFLFFKYVIGITIISGNSMAPTLENKDVIITSNLFYTLKRNDIVVYQDENGNHIIKRVIALPYETVEIKDGKVFIDGEPKHEHYTTGQSNSMEEVIVDGKSYFLIGDNREPGESLDSRNDEVGSISEEQLTGKAIFSLYPFRMSFD